jgi:hypothetical protein
MLNGLTAKGQTANFHENRVRGKIRNRLGLAMLPLYFSLAVLAVLILSGIVASHLRFRSMEQRLISLECELHQFYRDLGRSKAEVISIKGRPRSG